MNNSLEKEYLEHKVFEQLKEYSMFYESLSFSIMNWITTGTSSLINIDTYMYSSMKGTLESISDILYKGRINDSYSLLRKFYDLVVINIYTNLYLDENIGIDNFINNKINNWVKGKEKIPSFGIMSEYIIKSEKVKKITRLIYEDGNFKGSNFEELRKRCNDHTHYLYYHNILSNDNEIHSNNRILTLDEFSNDLKDIFILHFSYLFYIKENYMMSSDYLDYLDCGLEPEDDSQYWVAPFIQNIFDTVIKTNRPDISKIILENISMKLE